MTKRFAGFALLLVIGMAGIIGVLLVARGPNVYAQTVKSIANDRSTYYRLKVKLAYKGEPQDFDIVVGCNVRQIFYKEGGSTYEAGLIPTVFGRRMNDGKGLVVRPPNACRGETTANGNVQPDLLPVIVVYDDADRLDFGIAYLSEDAYESPLSVLKFGGATIEKATKADFEEFRQAQTNLVTRAKYHSISAADVVKRMGLPEVAEPWAYMCEGYARFRIPDSLRAQVQSAWPEGRPNYWVADSYDAESEIGAALRRSTNIQADHDPRSHPFQSFGNPGDGAADLGFPTRAGGGRVLPTRGGVPASYYPAANDYRADQWPADRRDWSRFVREHADFADTNIDFRGGATNGLAYCVATVRGRPDAEAEKIEAAKRIIGRIDNHRIVSKRLPRGPGVRPIWIFERDEYAWRFVRVYLGSPRGDV